MGWGYEGWSGTFYQKNLPKSKFLKFYSSVFDIAEINSTFYAIPREPVVKKWNADTPAHFKFTAKLPQIITHQNKLQILDPHLEQFVGSLKPLKTKFLFAVVQLPPWISFEEARPNLELLNSFLANSYVIEGRHKTWFENEAIRYLSDKKIGLVWSDVYGVKNLPPLTTDFVYLRLIGDRSIPEKEFGRLARDKSTDLQFWAEKLACVQDKAASSLIMINNRYEGFGPGTANKLSSMLGMERFRFCASEQKTLEGQI
jgi:uncharacterized protein YecE (DUF72 family)